MMRVYDFGLSSPKPDYEIDFSLYENEIVLAPFTWTEPPKKAIIGKINDQYVYSCDDDGLIYISVGNPSMVYLLYQKTSTNWNYALTLHTNPSCQKQGWATKLILYFVNEIGPIVMDRQLSMASASMIEKMVNNKLIKGNIAYLDSGEMIEYNPDDASDVSKPLYDKMIPNIKRPVLSDGDAKNVTWVLEKFTRLRDHRLQKYIRECRINTICS